MYQMARIERDAKKGVAYIIVNQVVQLATRRANADMLIPFHDGAEIRRDEFLHVIADTFGQSSLVFHEETPARGIRTPHAQRRKDRLAFLNPLARRAGEAKARSLAAHDDRMVHEWYAAPVHRLYHLVFGHPRLYRSQHIPYSL